MNDYPITEENLKYFDHAVDIWDSRIVRKFLAEENSKWIYGLRPWTTFLTLTFKNETAPDVANALFKRLISTLNEEVFGKHYTRIVGHCYFSYVIGIEYQKRDVIHFHVLIDRPVDYKKIHTLWNAWAGFGWSEIIVDVDKVVNYVSKYIVKGGEILPYLAPKKYMPINIPFWWNDDQEDFGTILKLKS
jgi:hypothetical protein